MANNNPNLVIEISGNSDKFQKEVNALYTQVKKTNDTMTNEASKTQGAFEKAQVASFGRMGAALNVLKDSFGAMIAVWVAVKAAISFGKAIDEMTLLEARVKQATLSADEAKQAWVGLKDITKQTGAEMATTVAIFQRLSLVRGEIGATVESMLQFTDTVSKLGIVAGASPEAMKAGLMQLGQGLSNSILRAEEFNSIMENIPAVGKAIADEFDITTGQLRNLVITGQVLSKDVFQAILNQSQKTNENFAKMPETIGRVSTGLLTVLKQILTDLSSSLGVTNALVGAIKFLTDAFKGVAVVVIGVIDYVKGLGIVGEKLFLELNVQMNEIHNNLVEKYNSLAGVFGKKFELGTIDTSAQTAKIKELEDDLKNLSTFAELKKKYFDDEVAAEEEKQAQIAAIKTDYQTKALEEEARLEQDKKDKEEKKRQDQLDKEAKEFEEDYGFKRTRMEEFFKLEGSYQDKQLAAAQKVLANKKAFSQYEVSLAENLVKQKATLGGLEVANEAAKLGAMIAGNSKAGKAFLAIAKAVSIATSIVKIQQGLAEALSLPFPANLAAYAKVLALGTSIVSTIRGVSDTVPTPESGIAAAEGGVVGGGYGGGDKVPALLERGEIIIPQKFNPLSPNFEQSFGGFGGQNVNVVIGLEEDASRILTVKQREDSKLGIQS